MELIYNNLSSFLYSSYEPTPIRNCWRSKWSIIDINSVIFLEFILSINYIKIYFSFDNMLKINKEKYLLLIYKEWYSAILGGYKHIIITDEK